MYEAVGSFKSVGKFRIIERKFYLDFAGFDG